MKKKYFSKSSPFINRKKEQDYINGYLNSSPESILRIYWPKSTWKTTMINKITNQLWKDYVVSSINFRGYLIGNYDMFVTTMFDVVKDFKEKNTKISRWDWVFDKLEKEYDEKRDFKKQEMILDLKVFKINQTQEKDIREKRLDPFQAMISILKNIQIRWKKPVIIFDEIQELRWLYMNGDRLKREILKEMFAFFISLTKELHLAHVICMTSESTFMDEIYNTTKLKNTSDFYRVDHLWYEDTFGWMKDENMTDTQANLVWEYLWWSPQEIWSVFIDWKNWDKQDDQSLKQLLENKVSDERSRLSDMVKNYFTKEQKQEFYEICKIIVKNWCFIEQFDKWVNKQLLNLMVEKDLWFYDSFKSEITANSQSVLKAMETIF